MLHRKTGILVFGNDTIKSYIRSLEENNTPHNVLTGKEANDRYPNQLTLPEDYICVTEDDGGILKANIAVSALQVYVITHCYVNNNKDVFFIK